MISDSFSVSLILEDVATMTSIGTSGRFTGNRTGLAVVEDISSSNSLIGSTSPLEGVAGVPLLVRSSIRDIAVFCFPGLGLGMLTR